MLKSRLQTSILLHGHKVKEDIHKHENPEAYFLSLVQPVITALVKDVNEALTGLRAEMKLEMASIADMPDFPVNKAISKMMETVALKAAEDLKGEKGDSIQGEKGDPFIPTEKDLQNIADKVHIPVQEKIIEKTEVVKQPIVTEVTKVVKETTQVEVAKYEEPLAISNKLNTLDQKVEQKVIIGLEERFEKIDKTLVRKEKGGGSPGGGMGNWVHERFSISSATTTITLANKIAANGLAHIARYQGQVQDLNTDYSVSGKVITLLFTPDDTTVFTIAYVRA